MTTIDQSVQGHPAPAEPELDEIARLVAAAREGAIATDQAFAAIGRLVNKRARTAETYQKPWG